MKLAVIFLCLSVASFIGTSKEQVPDTGSTQTLTNTCCNAWVYWYGQACYYWNYAQNCPENEIPRWHTNACECCYHCLISICKMCNQTPEQMLRSWGCTTDQANAMIAVNVDLIVKHCGSTDYVVNMCGRILQACLAQANVCLQVHLTPCLDMLDCGHLIHDFTWLHSNVGNILAGMALTALTALRDVGHRIITLYGAAYGCGC
ncbi:uncharacterized protein [Eleutherodactylus coqui]|uniref:uncharacterized protein n=1 Tax=Eleutherodactylus coqui TaxID=57060 RepID=UPI0034625DC6